MTKFTFSDSEIVATKALVADLLQRFASPEDPAFLCEAAVYAQELPRRLRLYLSAFRLHEPQPGYCIVSGYPVDDDRIGDTPKHWKDRRQPSPTLDTEVFLVLVGSLFGEPIGWATQQSGYLVHDLIPIAGHEKEQLGTGCEELLWWHTEDAFHPCRGDYLALLCLRNQDRVGTTCGGIDVSRLSPRHLQLLFEPHYTIRPDESHLQKNSAQPAGGTASELFATIEKMNSAPEKIAVLHGSQEQPYLRIDPYFMDPLHDNPEAQEALEALIAAIDSGLEEVVINPGEIFVIDNFRMVHGRKAFKARHDGRDRWLKRINISRDLRKSRSMRPGACARVLHG